MGFLKPISKMDFRSNGLTITADKQDRLCFSKELQKELQLVKNDLLYLYFDEVERRIGVSKTPADDSHVPYVYNDEKRGTAQAADFMRQCGIDTSEQSIKFLYEGKEKGVMVFRQSGVRRPQIFKQEKNGNLIRTDE